MQDYKEIYRRILHDPFPEELTISFGGQVLRYRKRTWKIYDPEKGQWVERGLRYGENPDQEAALYELVGGNLVLGDCKFIEPGRGLVSALREEDLLQFGKHPGKINLTDVDSALNILKYLMDRPTACVMKHNNPSGVAQGTEIAEAFERAFMADRIAAFGGCVVLNRPVDRTTAELLARSYLEVVAAPEYEEGAIELLERWKNLRIIRIDRIDRLAEYADLPFVEFKALMDGGLILQRSFQNKVRSKEDLKPAVAHYQGTEYRILREPDEREAEDMIFGWAVEQGVTSNSVIFVKDRATVAIGTGEQDRVGVVEIAIFKAYTKYADQLAFKAYGIPYRQLEEEVTQGKRPREQKEEIDRKVMEDRGGLRGSVMISDGFFPFRDGVDRAIREGITAILQPGGSERDYESIEACNSTSPPVAMAFTGQRCFRH
ncbi:MAG TPA: IMP cyclohydrolase [Deltaproteobacteria bacterium]|nr:IMP cyclohydrolase [Deltaproteobacteria bacterium]